MNRIIFRPDMPRLVRIGLGILLPAMQVDHVCRAHDHGLQFLYSLLPFSTGLASFEPRESRLTANRKSQGLFFSQLANLESELIVAERLFQLLLHSRIETPPTVYSLKSVLA